MAWGYSSDVVLAGLVIFSVLVVGTGSQQICSSTIHVQNSIQLMIACQKKTNEKCYVAIISMKFNFLFFPEKHITFRYIFLQVIEYTVKDTNF